MDSGFLASLGPGMTEWSYSAALRASASGS